MSSKQLTTESSQNIIALAFVCAYILECQLNALLGRNGDVLRNRHNIAGLWRLCAVEGLPIPKELPAWAEMLSELHDSPYAVRYLSEPKGVESLAMRLIVAELRQVLEVIRLELQRPTS